MRSQLSDQPRQAMHRLTQWYSPVMLLRLGHVPTLVLSSPEAAKEVMKAPGEAVFASQPGGENFSLAELLSPGHIRSFRPFLDEEAACLAASISFTMSYCGPVLVDVRDRAKAMMKDIFMKIVFGDYPRWKSVFFMRSSVGHRCPQLEAYLEELHEVLDVMSGLDPSDLFPTEEALGGGSQRATQEVHERFRSIMDALIRYHTMAMESEEADAGPDRRGDILTTLLLLRRDGGMTLTDENIGSVLFEIFSVGLETTSTTIIWAMSELMKSPQKMTIAQLEIRRVLHHKNLTEANIDSQLPYLQMIIKETLRLHPPMSFIITRLCTEPGKIRAYNMLPRTNVLVNMWAIGRDEKSWTNATEFLPERFEDEVVDYDCSDFYFLPCDARHSQRMMFGMSSIEIALASLLWTFDWKLLSGRKPEELDMPDVNGITKRGRTELLLEAIDHFLAL
ncbi:premnaspirodiene oxygenase-like [Triticum dicoccoides]|uniref:premnaspirodiene oxygenase-like n=1 Tax=Triticum dicoccoides TaxID=85692 RepID=UPI00188E2C02|nr:premnaspirodiene oxygenase-like [Triticum dicoccoides]